MYLNLKRKARPDYNWELVRWLWVKVTSTKPDNMVQSPEPIGGRRTTPETCPQTAIHVCLSTHMHSCAPAYKIKKFSIAMCIHTQLINIKKYSITMLVLYAAIS